MNVPMSADVLATLARLNDSPASDILTGGDSLTAGIELGLPHAAIASLGTILIIGLGFIARPRPSTLYWSLAFLGTMLASFAYIAAVVSEMEWLRLTSLGIMFGAPVLIWSGIRALRGVPALAWIAAIISVGAAGVLLLTHETAFYAFTYRVAYLAGSVFGALFIWEWYRSTVRGERILLPAVVVSGLFAASGVLAFIAGIAAPGASLQLLETVRVFSSVGMLIYMTSLLVSLVPFVTPSAHTTRSGRATDRWEVFATVVRSRLERARTHDETSWALLQVTLDDAEDLLRAGGQSVLTRLVANIERRVREIFPAGADIATSPDGAIIALVNRPEGVVRDLVRQSLRRIARHDPTSPISITPSASIGWTTTAVSGFDFDILMQVTADAAKVARDKGGDRWERVGS
ncbi:hypothetical protein GCM10009808_26580 [Microbacterium sediminicola]|uniref:GGDEF domain-containing protein n=1 Tax=Microbacterium sediminicola TaxID=415210 RepID=A0ABN2IM46_9MICO